MMIIYSCYFLLTIFLMIDITESQELNFTCFHSEGYFGQYNISQEIIPCPSRFCLILRTYCDNYWAATCFNPSRPMAIFTDFEMAKKIYETRTHWSLGRCPGFKENCNDVYVPTYLADFRKPFTSLDSLLWTNLNLPKPRYLVISEEIFYKNKTRYIPHLINNEKEIFRNMTFSSLSSMVPDNSLMINTTDELLSPHNGYDHPVIKINLPDHLIIWNEMTYEFRESLAPLSNMYKLTIQVYEEDRLKILHSYRNHLYGVETMRWNVQYIICKFSSYLIISLKNNGKLQLFCNFELVNGLDVIGYHFFNQTKFVIQSKKIDSMCL